MRLGRFAWTRLDAFNATWPLVALEVHSAGVRLVPTIGLIPRPPTWEARYDELSEVRAVGKLPIVTTGVRLRVGDGEDEWVVFWHFRRRKPMQALENRGIRVRWDADRLNYFNPGRRASDQ